MNEWLPIMVATTMFNSAMDDNSSSYATRQAYQPHELPLRKTKREMEVENSRRELAALFGENCESYTFGWSDPRSIYK